MNVNVVNTARCALEAKQSALTYGQYEPFPCLQSVYTNALQHMISHSSSDSTSTRPPKRQTPLVNAGYAVRMAILSHTLKRCAMQPKLQSILLVQIGAGLDVSGIWSLALAHKMGFASATLLELDCSSICQSKCQTLLKSGLLKQQSTHIYDETNKSIHARGIIDLELLGYQTLHDFQANYVLAETDLNDASSLHQTWDQVFAFIGDNSSMPIIFVCELVLCYLPQTSQDNVFKFVSSVMSNIPNSIFMCYEPISTCRNKEQYDTSCKTFNDLYCEQFNNRLTNGNGDLKFFPFIPTAHERMRSMGLAWTKSLTACEAAKWLNLKMLASEPFDEHSAYLLHLNCYALFLGFSQSTPISTALRIWKHTQPVESHDKFRIMCIDSPHQESVRSMFRSTYEVYFEKYPPIRRMVKNALNDDLSTRMDKSKTSLYHGSQIRAKYWSMDGEFLVATIDDEFSTKCSKRQDKMIGFIGIRKCGSQEYNSALSNIKSLNDVPVVFELKRFAVHPQYRRNGIGKRLLQEATSFVEYQCSEAQPIVLVATTSAIFQDANSFYTSNGFELGEKQEICSLTLNVYIKSL